MIELEGGRHPIGDLACRACCYDEPAHRCEEEGCSGVVHSAVVDEMEIGDDWVWVHAYRCDGCGATHQAGW